MKEIKNVLVTGTGVIAEAVVRALVPAGYNVVTLGLSDKGLRVFKKLDLNWESSPERVESILKGGEIVDPFLDLGDFVYNVPHHKCDLVNLFNIEDSVYKKFSKADAVIMTASNPDCRQSKKSAEDNHKIDINTINAAISSGVKQIIYTSSVWRTRKELEDPKIGLERLIKPEVTDKNISSVPYSQAKENSVSYLRSISEKLKDHLFSYIDMGWHPRETIGFPISNFDGRTIQWWYAECELQQHYLLLLNILKNSEFNLEFSKGRNLFAFNGFSQNDPPSRLNHPRFAYDLSNSRKLGVKTELNIYSILKDKTSSWRRIPIPSH